jgi:hypothetical protein
VSRAKREPRAITIAELEQIFDLESYWFGSKWCPAVWRRESGSYGIRVIKSLRLHPGGRDVTYDYFELDADGTVATAPRGYAREFKPGRVVDITEAVERYATSTANAMRIGL